MNSADLKYQQRLKTRARILDAARTIVSQSGYTALTMRRLALAVNYSPAALYLHFASREEIALTLRDEARLALIDALLAALPATAPTPTSESEPEPEPKVRSLAAARRARLTAPRESTPLLRLAYAWLAFARAYPHHYQLALLEPLAASSLATSLATSVATSAATAATSSITSLLQPILAAVEASPALAGHKAQRRSSLYRRALQTHAEWAMATLHGVASLALLQPDLLDHGAESLLDAVLPVLERGPLQWLPT
ncbi:TetR/AcrR family transcriptional regulator [Burkholderia sp. L27(2015)]|uniref:TetR/AcrR family transcriptional regulator n=1 Tax=Burkholderia sp. L27(2015) TaxID=1641858 RepID=UPI00131DDA2B|nr:helix-turn-helix domain-containing protein [Burkholderia sp. L27(2015)]